MKPASQASTTFNRLPSHKPKDNRPTAIDLFAGCGGLTAGLSDAGFIVVAAVEIDPMAARVYKANHSETQVWETDIRGLNPQQLLDQLDGTNGQVDLLAGCPPCQGFSTLRSLNGAVRVDDPRSNLIHDFQRFVQVIQPKVVMLENVPDIVKENRFALFCENLRQAGYVGEHRILDAADYGVPQRRRRLVYLAGKGFSLPFGRRSTRRRTVRDVLLHLPKAGISGDSVHDLPERRSERVKSVMKHIPKDGGSRADLPSHLQLRCHNRCNGFADVYGRIAWSTVAPTITSGCFNPSKGRFLHPEEDRAITIREASLLQGFPPDYDFLTGIGKEALARMIGNAIPPPLVASQGRSILRHFRAKDRIERMEVRDNGRQPDP